MSCSDSVAVPVPEVTLHFGTISIPSPNLTYYLLVVAPFCLEEGRSTKLTSPYEQIGREG